MNDYVDCQSTQNKVLFSIQVEVSSIMFSALPTSAPIALEPASYGDSDFIGIHGAPYYAISFTVVLFVMFGVVLVRKRDISDKAVPLKLSEVCLNLGLFGATIASEIAYIVAILSYSDVKLRSFAVIILVARLSHIPGGVYILKKIWGNGDKSSRYLELIDMDDLLKNREFVYSPLFLISLLDNTNIAYLPWLGSTFASYSGGYPDFFLYRTCITVKLCQSGISTMMQVSVLIIFALKYHGGFSSVSFNSRVFFILSIVSSILALIVTSTGVLVQYSILKTIVNNSTSTSTSTETETNNPMNRRIGII
jgi:hypothetical protein